MPLEDEQVRALRAVAHPVRLQILSLLTGAELSAAEIARELDITQANASYHVRVLARAGELVECGTERVRGGRAKKYRYVAPPHTEEPGDRSAAARGSAGSAEAMVLLVEAYATELRRRVRQRDVDAPSDFTDAELWLEPKVWAEVLDLVLRASTAAHEGARPPRTPGTVHTSFSSFLFQLASEESGDSGPSDGDA